MAADASLMKASPQGQPAREGRSMQARIFDGVIKTNPFLFNVVASEP
jgi:hypothetical protein